MMTLWCCQPTLRNKLGAKALKYLKKGKACDDQLLVDIVVDAIRSVIRQSHIYV